jgi:hypothetical protein
MDLPLEYRAFLDRLFMVWLMGKNRDVAQPLPTEMLLLLLHHEYVTLEKLGEEECEEVLLIGSEVAKRKQDMQTSIPAPEIRQALLDRAKQILLFVEGLRFQLMSMVDSYAGEDRVGSWGSVGQSLIQKDLLILRFGFDLNDLQKYYLKQGLA